MNDTARPRKSATQALQSRAFAKAVRLGLIPWTPPPPQRVAISIIPYIQHTRELERDRP
ncbi:MAG: hypothetical protein ACREMD_15490 [Gemmatimonadota bacterium]